MLNSIQLRNFRSYSDASFEFEPSVNIVVGPNASGKTNLLEAVMVLARGRSYKAGDLELIKYRKDWARLEGLFDASERVVKIENLGESSDKSFLINATNLKRLNFERSIPIVLFEPNHTQIIAGSPSGRRDWADDILERTQPEFKSLSANYRRTLAQRNALLKRGERFANEQLFAWDVRLGELGAQIVSARTELARQINQKLATTYNKIAGRRSKLHLTYQSEFPVEHYASRLVAKLGKSFQIDLARGFTGHGPHREDFLFELNAHPAGITASRGETRSLILALKKIEAELMEQSRGQPPILLLDDVFSELDGKRRRALVELLAGRQAILTTTDADAVLEYFDRGHKLIALK